MIYSSSAGDGSLEKRLANDLTGTLRDFWALAMMPNWFALTCWVEGGGIAGAFPGYGGNVPVI